MTRPAAALHAVAEGRAGYAAERAPAAAAASGALAEADAADVARADRRAASEARPRRRRARPGVVRGQGQVAARRSAPCWSAGRVEVDARVLRAVAVEGDRAGQVRRQVGRGEPQLEPVTGRELVGGRPDLDVVVVEAAGSIGWRVGVRVVRARAAVLLAGSSARCEARSAPSVMIDSLPSGATSASLAYQSVSVAVDDATRCRPDRADQVERPARAARCGRSGRGALEALVGRHVRRRRDRAVLVERHAEAGGRIGDVRGRCRRRRRARVPSALAARARAARSACPCGGHRSARERTRPSTARSTRPAGARARRVPSRCLRGTRR